MSVSVVISTYNRRAGLENTLDGLRRQTFREFEVVVVHGPSADGTTELLDRHGDAVRAVPLPERHLSRSRNAGIDVAAGDVVAFIDDDAVPEPRWLEDLVGAYDDERVGGAGGLVLDHTGVRPQYRYSVCHRTGDLDFDREPPLDRYVQPGADPFLFLQGTNCSFRRTALEAIGGFDEEIEYNFDEAEVCLQLIDAGWRLRALATAVVHHRFLPSDRRTERAFTDPFLEVKNRVYFALRHAPTRSAALTSANRYLGLMRASAREACRRGRLSDKELTHYLGRADAGFHLGLRRGMDRPRSSRHFADRDARAFRAYPVLRPDRWRRVAVVDHHADAAKLAAAGHEAHLLMLAGSEAAYRIDHRDGVWIHSVPVGSRWLPELDGSALRSPLERAAAVRGALDTIRDRGPVEVEFDLPRPLCGFLDARRDDIAALLVREAALTAADAARAAHRLLERHRFPTDHELAVRACLDLRSNEEFVDCLYQVLLGRAPEAYGRMSSLAHLDGGETLRVRLVDRIAGSPEARGRGVDPVLVERLPTVTSGAAEVALRDAWARKDDVFARAAHRLLIGVEADAEADAERLQRGMSRQTLIAELVARPDVRERVVAPERLPPRDARSEAEFATELTRLARLPPRAFVAGAYELLLGRAPEPDGAAAFESALSTDGRPRAGVIRALATSIEARAHGTPGDIVVELVRADVRYRLDAVRAALRRRARRITALVHRA